MSQEILCYDHYVYTKILDLNLVDINKSCERLRQVVKDNFVGLPDIYNDIATETTYPDRHYNTLLYPYNGFHQLYHEKIGRAHV